MFERLRVVAQSLCKRLAVALELVRIEFALDFCGRLAELADALRERGLPLLRAHALVAQSRVEFRALLGRAAEQLENLPSWVFVEWSKANDLVQDVNYPSNMTYAAMLDSAARMYGMPELHDSAQAVRETVRRQSFDGEFFIDNAKRLPDGTLKPSGERTEVCQYYAFFFGTATPESHPALWETMRRDFGPDRKINNKHPDIYFANAMIGQPMRLELLSRMGLSAQILEETRDYFRKMANITGTLWEHDSPTASCSHGFASHVERLLYRDVLGIREIDYVGRKVVVGFADVPLDHCSGSMPAGDSEVSVVWRKDGDVFRYGICAPEAFEVVVDTSRIADKFSKIETFGC